MTTTLIPGFPAYKLSAARAAIAQAHARLERAAVKAGQTVGAAPTLAVTRTYVISSCTSCHCQEEGFVGGSCIACRRGHFISREVLDLEVSYERPVLAGWDFLAVVEPLEGGNLIRQVPGADVADGELSPWRTGEIACDHCETRRRRAETFVVRADGSDPAIAAGTYKQVGRSCLAAFLGGKSAAWIIASLSMEKIIRDAGEEGSGGWSGPGVYDPAEFMAWAASSVRIAGWVSKGAALDGEKQSTASHVGYLLTPQYGSSPEAVARWNQARETFAPTDDDKIRGSAALAWARELPEATDYERNLKLVACQSALDPKHSGILASAISAHARAIGETLRREFRALTPSTHLGTVGDKKRAFGRVTLECVSSVDTQYGALHIHTFRDAAGCALVWKTGEGHGSAGDVFDLVGGVKAHTEYRGEKQTELSRCKLTKEIS